MRVLMWAAVLKASGCILLSWGIIGMISSVSDDALVIAALSGAAIGAGAVLIGATELFREGVNE